MFGSFVVEIIAVLKGRQSSTRSPNGLWSGPSQANSENISS
jgi:hypothetical protein